MESTLVIKALGVPSGGGVLVIGENNIFGVNGSYDPIAIINTPSV